MHKAIPWLLIGLLGGACSSTPAPAPSVTHPSAAPTLTPQGPPPFVDESTGGPHPLQGQIVRARDGAPVEWTELSIALSDARFVLTGEKHDNPNHHRLQAWVYDTLGARREPPPVAVFEMLDADQQDALHHLLHGPDPTPQDIADLVHWADSGWPAFTLYKPIFASVLAADGQLLAAGLPRQHTMELARGQTWVAMGPYGEHVGDRYGLSLPLPVTMQNAQRELMQEAHCGMLPEGMLDGMVRVQRARDAMLAEALRRGVSNRPNQQAVLFAGAGHVRRDLGVPTLLEPLNQGPIVVIAFIEVQAEWQQAQPYLDAHPGQFDYLWFTPAAPSEDHCAALRKHFQDNP